MRKKELKPSSTPLSAQEDDIQVLEQALSAGSNLRYAPQLVNRSLVTLDEVTSMLHDIPIDEQLDEAIAAQQKTSVMKVSVADKILDHAVSTRAMPEMYLATIDAIFSQLAAGNRVFTASMLFRTMTGKESNYKVDKGQQEKINKIVSRLMYTPLSIDLDVRGINGEEGNGKIGGAIIPAENIKINMNGTTCMAYQLTNVPMLYRYCMATKGLSVTPLSMLAVEMNYTTRNMSILNFLQRRVSPKLYPTSGDYTPTDVPITITYDEIYATAQQDSENSDGSSNVIAMRVREVVQNILNTWVDAGFLAKWENVTKRRRYVAVKLYLPFDNPPPLPENPSAALPSQDGSSPIDLL